MEESELYQWLIEVLGAAQAQAAWQQLQQLPAAMREQLLQQSVDQLPKPEDMRQMLTQLMSGNNGMAGMTGMLGNLFGSGMANSMGNTNPTNPMGAMANDGQSAQNEQTPTLGNPEDITVENILKSAPAQNQAEPDTPETAPNGEASSNQTAEGSNHADSSMSSESSGDNTSDDNNDSASASSDDDDDDSYNDDMPLWELFDKKNPPLVNVKMATSFAKSQLEREHPEHITAQEAQQLETAFTNASLWLDSACELNPPQGKPQRLTQAQWAVAAIRAWVNLARPVFASVRDAMVGVFAEHFGMPQEGEDGGVMNVMSDAMPVPFVAHMNNPKEFVSSMSSVTTAMQLWRSSVAMAPEVKGSFDQGIMVLQEPAGGLVASNCFAYAHAVGIDAQEVLAFLALRELAHARLYAAVPWLMPRFESLIAKYASGIAIDTEALDEHISEQLAMQEDADNDNGERTIGIDIEQYLISNTPEQADAKYALETLLALVEGWVDTVVAHAGAAHVPHLDQLREMERRERAMGGVSEQVFAQLMGLQLRPRRLREAAQLWQRLTAQEGTAAREGHWAHPDMLPAMPQEADAPRAAEPATKADWDAELSQLLDADGKSNDSDNDNAHDNDNGGAHR